jgi:uncharacterized protein with von Willebrand factor type A (vWA) domain
LHHLARIAGVSVGLEDRSRSRGALLACLASTSRDLAIASRLFDAFFLSHRRPRSLKEALVAANLAATLDVVTAWLESERIVDHEADLAFMVGASHARRVGAPVGLAYAVTNGAHLSHARHQLGSLGTALRGAFDREIADGAIAIVEAFVEQAIERTHKMVNELYEAGLGPPLCHEPHVGGAALDRLLRQAASQLRCRLRRRQRQSHGQAIDRRALLREQSRTHGAPVRLPRLRNRRRAPALYFLCDVSDSTRPAVDLLLRFMTRAAYFFMNARCYIFASTTVEFTRYLAKDGNDKQVVGPLMDSGLCGQVSNYGASIREFTRLTRSLLDRRSVVVILGDGRANYRDPGLTELAALRARVREVVWLCSESPRQWTADSLMPRYRAIASRTGQLASYSDVGPCARLIGSLR